MRERDQEQIDRTDRLRTRMKQRLQGERGQIPQDAELLGTIEAMEELFRWERELLEEGSKRVYSSQRSLLPAQRQKLEEIRTRRMGASEAEEEEEEEAGW